MRAEQVIAASGLRPRMVVSKPQLSAILHKMMDTGFFQGLRYDTVTTGSGYVVTLYVMEERFETPISLDVSDVEASALWQALKTSGSLAGPLIPNNSQATAYCQHAVEAALQQMHRGSAVVMMPDVDMKTGKTGWVLRSANPPTVGGVHFEGSSQVDAAVLSRTVSRLLVGKDYSERNARLVIEANLKPLYEEKGFLRVAFPSIKSMNWGEGSVALTVTVDEGSPWLLGKVAFVGEGLPQEKIAMVCRFQEGQPANWKAITDQIASVETLMKHDGYLRVSWSTERHFRDADRKVDVTVAVKPGPLYRLGELRLEAVDSQMQGLIRKAFKLREGDPMDTQYVKAFAEEFRLGAGRGIRLTDTLKLRPGTTIFDLILMPM